MLDSPRNRRLKNDLVALEQLASESSIFTFKTQGNPPFQYTLFFAGRGLSRDRGKVKIQTSHQVEIKLGASYPRTIPELRWLSAIYHPNISEIGMVCLGGYGTHWVPSVQLDELCQMLWDMARYHNYDIRSPYNRDAALWVANQTAIRFPTDVRALRDLRIAQGRVESNSNGTTSDSDSAEKNSRRSAKDSDRSPLGRVRRFIERYGRSYAVSDEPPTEAVVHTAHSQGLADYTSVAATYSSPMPPAEIRVESVPSIEPAGAIPPIEDEFTFLEDDESSSPAPPPRAPVGDDILFIE